MPGNAIKHVHHAADQLIDAAAVVPGNRADDHADDRRHADHDQADQQRDARAEQHARQDVAPQLVEAEPVLPASDPAGDSADPAWPRSHGSSHGAPSAAEHDERDDGEAGAGLP